jgi:dipeptidyl aminopeptidase/acylaminoacyl peptidase
MSMRLKLGFIFLWLFLIISFGILGIILVTQAAGFRVDWRRLKIEQTGLIYLDSQPRNPQIYLDGRLVKLNHRKQLTMLPKGSYDLEVRKANYQTWSSAVEVKEGWATILDHVQLFLKEPQISEASKEEMAYFEKIKPEEKIKIIDGTEIRIIDDEVDSLVTRFSYPIKNVRWFPDKKHLAYLAKGEIRIIELDGGNNMLLLSFKEGEDVEYYFSDNGKSLIFKIDDEVKKARVQ